MQLYLIRHAESQNNAKNPHDRTEDPPITNLGKQQAQFLSSWTRTLNIDTLISSPFRRALETTRELLAAVPQHVHVWHDIFERGGCYRGYLPADKQGAMGLGPKGIRSALCDDQNNCTIDNTIHEAGWWGGRTPETDDQASQRASAVTVRLQDTFGDSGKSIVAVTHADFKRLLLGAMLPEVLDPTQLGSMRNTGITKVNYDGSRWQLDWFNSVSHLPAELITGNEA
jgi:2,3-bisphosphoglycerate-dependent phosphoglycerate mutase